MAASATISNDRHELLTDEFEHVVPRQSLCRADCGVYEYAGILVVNCD